MAATIALDFDGVLHEYSGKEQDFPIPGGGPVHGARAAVKWMLQRNFSLVIFSARSNDPGGEAAIQQWLEKHQFPQIPISLQKPIADLYVDDRGFRFEGPASFDDLVEFLTRNPVPGRWRKA